MSLDVLTGDLVYMTVYAVDAAGLVSEAAVSDGATVDLTPPQPEQSVSYGENLVKNPSFEELNNDSLPVDWNVEGEVRVIDASFVELKDGTIYQQLEMEANARYRLTIQISQGSGSGDTTYTIIPCAISVANLHTAVGIYDQPTAQFTEYTYYFSARNDVEQLTFSTLTEKGSVFLNDVIVQQIHSDDSKIADTLGHVDVDLNVIGGRCTVTASWAVIDPESPIVNYKWAIGTVFGEYRHRFYYQFSDVVENLVVLKSLPFYQMNCKCAGDV